MLEELTNLKKMKRIYKKIFDKQLFKGLDEFDILIDFFMISKVKFSMIFPLSCRFYGIRLKAF